MFEGLEHVSDPERAVAALASPHGRGLRALVSIPNSVALGEVDNPFTSPTTTTSRRGRPWVSG